MCHLVKCHRCFEHGGVPSPQAIPLGILERLLMRSLFALALPLVFLLVTLLAVLVFLLVTLKLVAAHLLVTPELEHLCHGTSHQEGEGSDDGSLERSVGSDSGRGVDRPMSSTRASAC